MACIPLPASLAALAGALLLTGCQRQVSCTVEVTEAKGVFRGTIAGTRSQVDIEREALRAACGQRCGAQGTPSPVGCVVQCATDADSGKLSKRTTCTEGSSR
jgi:hypothetical protein